MLLCEKRERDERYETSTAIYRICGNSQLYSLAGTVDTFDSGCQVRGFPAELRYLYSVAIFSYSAGKLWIDFVYHLSFVMQSTSQTFWKLLFFHYFYFQPL